MIIKRKGVLRLGGGLNVERGWGNWIDFIKNRKKGDWYN